MIHRALFILRRRWPLLVALPVVAAAAAFVMGPSASSRQHTTYASRVVISADQAGANQTDVQQQLVKATQGQMAAIMAPKVGPGVRPADIAKHITTSFDTDTFVATAQARAASPTVAAAYARAFADVFVKGANDAAKVKLAETDSTVRPPAVYELVTVSDPHPLAPGKLVVFASPLFRAGLGAVLGLVAAALVVLLVERMNPRIDDPAQLEALIDAPVLAMVPMVGRRRHKIVERVDPAEFRGPFAESFRTMRAHLDFRAKAAGLAHPPRIMVASAAPSEGKSTTAAFLALSYAETDRQPVVVGGDLRRPTIHRLFGIDRMPGLTTRGLPGGESVPLTRIVRHDAVAGVTVVPSGPSVESVTSVTRDLKALTEVAQSADQVVILDTAPVRVANDALDFLPAVDWVVLVVKAGKSSARAVTQMMHTLRMNGAEVVGVVVVGSVESADATRDYYSYYAPVERRQTRRRAKREADPRQPDLVPIAS